MNAFIDVCTDLLAAFQSGCRIFSHYQYHPSDCEVL